jgi:transcriptional regulator with XRE-family HTH domain
VGRSLWPPPAERNPPEREDRTPMPEPSPLLFLMVEKLRAAREARGISQEELAAMCGFTEKQIAKWERNFRQPSAFLMAIWAHALGFVMLPVEASTVQSELKASMDAVSQARLSETATTSSCSGRRRARSAASSCSPSTTSRSTESPSGPADRWPAIPGIFDTETRPAA